MAQRHSWSRVSRRECSFCGQQKSWRLWAQAASTGFSWRCLGRPRRGAWTSSGDSPPTRRWLDSWIYPTRLISMDCPPGKAGTVCRSACLRPLNGTGSRILCWSLPWTMSPRTPMEARTVGRVSLALPAVVGWQKGRMVRFSSRHPTGWRSMWWISNRCRPRSPLNAGFSGIPMLSPKMARCSKP